jgi:hypothetical protein
MGYDKENDPIVQYVHQPLGYNIITNNHPWRYVWNNENLIGFYLEHEETAVLFLLRISLMPLWEGSFFIFFNVSTNKSV